MNWKNLTQNKHLRWILAVLLILALDWLGYSYPTPEPPMPDSPLASDVVELGTSHFTNVSAEDVTATDDLSVTDDATIGDDLTVTGDFTASTDLVIDDTLNVDETANALAGTQTLTPTATYYQLAPATTLTLTLATGSATDGDLLILHNTVTTSTVIVDTGATVGGGNVTVGSNDLAIFIFGNSKWIEWASPDNS